MIEVSPIVLTLLTEISIVLAVVVVVMILLRWRGRGKDRKGARKLVEQIKHQAENRHESSRDFLQKKYGLEGTELDKAIKTIDKAERKFFQQVLNLYLKRDADALGILDAHVAELVDVYKDLAPAQSASQTEASAAQAKELTQQKALNEKLNEELAITKQTMSNMISEFGNMFGGGHDHEMAKFEVVDKLKQISSESDAASATADDSGSEAASAEVEQSQIDDDATQASETTQDEAENAEVEIELDESTQTTEAVVSADEDIDDLLK